MYKGIGWKIWRIKIHRAASGGGEVHESLVDALHENVLQWPDTNKNIQKPEYGWDSTMEEEKKIKNRRSWPRWLKALFDLIPELYQLMISEVSNPVFRAATSAALRKLPERINEMKGVMSAAQTEKFRFVRILTSWVADLYEFIHCCLANKHHLMEVDIRSWRSFVTNVSSDSDSKTTKGIKAAHLGRFKRNEQYHLRWLSTE